MAIYIAMAIPVILLATFVWCMLFCDKCEERDKQMQADARQMKVARELANLARKERVAKEDAYLVAIMGQRRNDNG